MLTGGRTGRRRAGASGSLLASVGYFGPMAENVARLRASYEVLTRTGEWPKDGLLGPDFKLHQDSSFDSAGVFHGPDAPGELMRRMQQGFQDMSFEAERFIEAPAGEVLAIVRVRARGKASGTAIDKQQAHVWSFTDGQATTMTVYGRPAEGLEAVGLEA